MTPDSGASQEEYAKRARELKHGILSSLEHGWQGYYYETFELAKENDFDYVKRIESLLKNNPHLLSESNDIKIRAKHYHNLGYKRDDLKFIFATEAYWVKDRFEKDNTNNHIVLIAKNENGRKAINLALSEANITGYYHKPRLDLELLLNLPKDDVFITTACIAFWQYDYADTLEIIQKLQNHFGKNFMLEVQYHNTQSQKDINTKILSISKNYGIDIIMGCDSHFISQEDTVERDNILEAKGIRYESEDGWYMDYPTGKEAFNRFKKQGILSDEEIFRAMDNTNILLTFEDITFNKDIKLPTLYPNLTQTEKDILFIKLIKEQWDNIKSTVPTMLHPKYQHEIANEVKCVVDTGMADYFLIDYYMVKDAVENRGGIITKSGRGSGVSFYINKLLGFTKVDRISAKVHMYPERFMSTTRILDTKSLPDLDLNVGEQQPFIDAQTALLGEGHSYPMIAFGTFKKKSAFKLYAKSQNLDYNIANAVSQQLEKYETALANAEDDDKDLIVLEDYVDEEYMPLIESSKKYEGIISDKKAHPCGHLLYSGDIKAEIGLIKCKTESNDKEVITTVIDGRIAEKYKFLKNDILKVDVVLINDKVYKRISMPSLDVTELIEISNKDNKIWDIYSKGFTLCINQTEQEKTREKMQRYKAQNISELCAFIAGIRPSFKSMYGIFEKREDFSYEIKAFDKLLQTEELPYSFVLYQEQIMATLSYAGFPASETYTIMKAISKKKPEIILPLKDTFIKGFGDKIRQEEPLLTQEAIEEKCLQVWTIIENSVAYGFNASHAYCVSCDSLDGAYLKANYPYEFYEVVLNHYSEKGNKDKVSALISEMDKGFNINLGEYTFRYDNRGFVANKEKNMINPSLASIKYIGKTTSDKLYELKDKQYDTFVDLLIDIEDNKVANSKEMKILINIDYFKEFGLPKKLMAIYLEVMKGKNKYDKKHTDKTKQKRIPLLKQFEKDLPNEDYPLDIKLKIDLEYLGYSKITIPNADPSIVMVVNIDTTYTHPILQLYKLQDGKIAKIKLKKQVFEKFPFEKLDMLRLTDIKEEAKRRFTNGRWIVTDQFEKVLKSYNILK
jgi:DNA polymerase III alpha subunit